MFNWGRIEDEFNSHSIGSVCEELIIYMTSMDDIYMNLIIIMRETGTKQERKGKKL